MARSSAIVGFMLLGILPLVPSVDLPRLKAGEESPPSSPFPLLKPALQALVDGGKVPGGVALVARAGKVVDVTTFGCRDLATRTPMTEDTIFAVASMTKPITCAALMTLVEQKAIGIDDPVEQYLPEFKELRVLANAREGTEPKDLKSTVSTVPAKRSVTIRHLLTHTSGIAYGVFDSTDVRLRELYRQAGVIGPRHKTLDELISRLAQVPLAHQPGEGWTYGFSHDVLARVIEVVSGRPFDQFLQERIFTPLDLPDTVFHVPDGKRDRVATIYDVGEGGRLVALPKEYGPETYFGGGGGLFSTARDYARFVQMLQNGGALDGTRILEPSTVTAMTTNQIGSLAAYGERKYGLGIGLALAPQLSDGATEVERYFGGGAYSTNFYVLPRHDLILLLMTQVTPTNHGGAELVFYRTVKAAIENEHRAR